MKTGTLFADMLGPGCLEDFFCLAFLVLPIHPLVGSEALPLPFRKPGAPSRFTSLKKAVCFRGSTSSEKEFGFILHGSTINPGGDD